MYSLKKILVPTDLSETSLNALETAVFLAKKHKASLHILNISETSPGIQEDGLHDIFSIHRNEDVLSALSGSIFHTHNITPTILQKKGHIVHTIISTAVSDRADLIVMGTHGASGIREGFIGTNTYNVIKYSTCPVLTIPPTRKFTSFKRVLFPIRPVMGALSPYHVVGQFLSPNSSLDVLGVSYRKMERELGVLDKIAGEINDQLTGDKIKVKMHWGTGVSVSDDILQFAQSSNPDLIILTSILDAVNKINFIGPYSQKLLNCSQIPLLSIKKIGVSMLA